MADPVIVPPVPTINQGDSPEEIARVGADVQSIFDRIAPDPTRSPSKAQEPKTTPTEPVKEPPKTPAPPAQPPEQPTPPVKEPEPHAVPSFIQKALEVDGTQPGQPPAPTADELPEELPTFKTPEEAKNNWKNFRTRYNDLKRELNGLKGRPALDEATSTRLAFLENQNRELTGQLNRYGIENHRDFQEKIIQPMQAAWIEAAKIVKEAGGNPDDLAKALALTGRNHFESLDEIFRDLPESAKNEAYGAVAAYRRLDEVRKNALANAPKTMEALRKQDLARQNDMLQRQKRDMGDMFDDAVRILRDEAKVELLMTSTDPDAKWWNEQGENLVNASRRLFLENQDMKKVAMACVLAPMVDTYRKLWLQERIARAKSDKIIKDKFGSEPMISDSGGNVPGETPSMAEDLKRPFAEVFLREFHKQRAAGVR